MTQIVPLQATRRVLTWVYVYPTDKSTNKWKKQLYISFSLIIFVTNFCGLAASIAFL